MCGKTQPCVELKGPKFAGVESQRRHTQLKLKMDVKLIEVGNRQVFMPDACPVCLTSFDTAITGGLAEFHGAYVRPTAIGHRGAPFEGEPEQKGQPCQGWHW